MNNYITTETSFDEIRRKNFFFYWFIASFVWMCFHFTLVFFFLLQLKSPLLVWLFLWFWNLVSFFADSPIWVLQKYFKSKSIFLTWAFLMLIVSAIFLYFIYSTNSVALSDAVKKLGLSVAMLQVLFGSVFNIFLLVLSVILYWIIKEISDVTSLSYVMNNADPSEYADILSKNNIFSGLWALTWLISSWIILSFNTTLAVSILVVLIIMFLFFIIKYFDSSTTHIDFRDLQKLKYITKESLLNSVKDYSAKILNKDELMQKAKWASVLFLKPLELKWKIDFNEIIETTKDDISSFFDILIKAPYNYRLLVMGAILVLFWFWDTFVTSFLIDFLDWVLKENAVPTLVSAYVFIAILAIPAYWAQIPLIWLWNKIWVLKVLLAWVLLSWISVFLFWFFETFLIILVLWILNSVWYAAAMPTSQAEFSTEYNNTYAIKKKLNQIDSNASAAPLKMLLNLANVLWLVVWWLLVWIFGYPWTFIVFGAILIIIFVASIVKGKEWKL